MAFIYKVQIEALAFIWKVFIVVDGCVDLFIIVKLRD